MLRCVPGQGKGRLSPALGPHPKAFKLLQLTAKDPASGVHLSFTIYLAVGVRIAHGEFRTLDTGAFIKG